MRPNSSPRAPRFPVYIVSKGRHETPLTSRALSAMGVHHYVVVEPQEFDAYRSALAETSPHAQVIELDLSYKETYDTFDDLGLTKGTGPGPARNFAWDHASSILAAPWHWVMDDNISMFSRLNYNLKTPAATGAIFYVMEEFCLRYENVAMAGPNYFFFAKRKQPLPAFITNTRIYSCNLIRNSVENAYGVGQWRGRYNEDTDLSLRMLKSGWVTVQFNAFLQYKAQTQALAGGNTSEFYAHEGTRPKSEMLARMHPDCAVVVEKFGRVHHHVDYSRFTQALRRRPEFATLPDTVDNFGMVLQQRLDDGRWVAANSPPRPNMPQPKYFDPEKMA